MQVSNHNLMIQTRFDIRYPYFIMLAAVSSFLLSLVLLQLFLGLLVILWLTEKNSEKKKAFDRFGVLILIFLTVRILSVVFSEYPELSVELLYKDALFYLGFFAMNFYFKAFMDEQVRTTVLVFSIASSVVAVIGLVQFNLSIVERAQSFSSGYSTFSSYLLTGFAVTLSSRLLYQNKLNLIYWVIASSVILAGIVTSLGRVNIVIAAIIFLSVLIIKRYDIKSGLLIIILSAIISFISFQNNSVQISQRVEAPAYLSDRDILLNAAKELAFEKPLLGFGPRTFDKVFLYRDQLADKGVGSWHNDFIQVYIESGAVGLLAFILLIVFPLYYAFKRIFKTDKSPEKDLTIGSVIAIIALVISGLTAGFISSPVLAPLFAYLLVTISREDLVKREK